MSTQLPRMHKSSARSARPSMASSTTTRTGAPARAGVRQATANRVSSLRQPVHHAVAASRIDRAAAASPADSLFSTTAGNKRKERDFDVDGLGEETNINVVVRCRGRNQREVKENSAVVVQTEGAKGKVVGLSMGPNALTNKAYNFDRVFSPASDQAMVYEEVVKPILEEVSAGPVHPPDHPSGWLADMIIL